MEKRVEFIGSIIIFFVLLFVYSKWGPAIPFSTTTQSKGEPLTVSETGMVSVTPDIAKINLGIETQGQSLKEVQNMANAKSKTLLDSLKRLDIDEKDIKTVSYNVYPEYDYSSRTPRITGYRVSTSYEVKIKDFDKVNEVLALAGDNGANVVGNISFEVNDKTKEELTNKAREEAVSKAKTKASDLAKITGITLGKIINVQESDNNGIRPVPSYDTKMAIGGALQESTPNITPGETEISVTVTLSYEVR